MTPEIRLLGIDPGLTGALALLGLTRGGPSLAVADMPEVHKTVDAAALAELIRRWPRPDLVVLEEVGPQPRDGVRQAFSFGQSYATARTVALMLEIPLHLVRPQAWKAHFRLRGGDEGKEAGRALALRRFPASAKLFARKKDHNRAEAALLALYGAERLLPAGSLPDPDRVREGLIRCLTNAMVLTTGFDAPGVDLIAMLRPTLSTGLYVQILGRGTRPVYPDGFDPNEASPEERRAAIAESVKANCLVLDFAQNVLRHGPVDALTPPARSGPARAAPEMAVRPETIRAKACPHCSTLVGLDEYACTAPGCGFEWERPVPKHDPVADAERPVMQGAPPPPPDPWVPVTGMAAARHVKRFEPEAPPTLRVDYACGFVSHAEWVCFEHQGVARAKAEKWWRDMRGRQPAPASVDEALERLEDGELARPSHIVVKQDGKFARVASRRFAPEELARVRAYAPRPVTQREDAAWWRVLGLDPFAHEDEVRAAFRRLAREHHPDHGGSHAAMTNINRAYVEGLRAVSPADAPF